MGSVINAGWGWLPIVQKDVEGLGRLGLGWLIRSSDLAGQPLSLFLHAIQPCAQ